ncbi:hypothetical protein AB0395_09815 [Streptosporangium sp. NPDC051023]|uniref:hypothetical protein n=1 Tax=Streptosporangium sp. NPDC051023 TaxID=3155410 RepID=UPI00344C7F39
MNARTPRLSVISDEALKHPRSLTAFRGMRLLVGGYVLISALTLVAVYLLRDNPALVNDAVWVRGGIVAVTSVVMLGFVVGTARGRRRSYLRLRLASAIMVVAVAVLISLPGFLPVWMRIEQAVCGLVLIGVVVIVNGRHLRSLFTAK